MATEIIRPSGSGAETNISGITGGSNHYSVMSDQSDSTYVYNSATNFERDLYALQNPVASTGTINSVTVYIRVYWTGGAQPNQNWAKCCLRHPTTIVEHEFTYSTDNPVRLTWYDLSYTWTSNPVTSAAWTWSDLDYLQAGVAIREAYTGGPANTYASEVWVEIDYTESSNTQQVVVGEVFKDIVATKVVVDESWKDVVAIWVVESETFKQVL